MKATFKKQENKKCCYALFSVCAYIHTTILLCIYNKALALWSSLNMFCVQYIYLQYIYL